MIRIAHRRNSIEELQATDTKYGIEVDIRSSGKDLIIHHDPFAPGPRLADWLHSYQHRTLIVNVKEEGLESRTLELLKQFDITDFFFLDQSFPFLVKWSGLGERRCAVRVSEFESVTTALNLTGQIDWVWVDCFTRFPLVRSSFQQLQAAGFKTCLVSPELQGRKAEESIPELRRYLGNEGIEATAVCTKRPDLWES